MTGTVPPVRLCVVGHGTAGDLHRSLLEELGYAVCVVDPAPTVPVKDAPLFDTPEAARRSLRIDAWSLCTPTEHHLKGIQHLLSLEPGVRLLVEKPICRAGDLISLADLLTAHPRARLLVMDQYRHAVAVDRLLSVLAELPDRPRTSEIRIGFAKDRLPDIAAGRFVDRDHGVFGYEWLHMLALLRRMLPTTSYDAYMSADPRGNRLSVVTHPDLVSTSALEQTRVGGVEVELYSTICGRNDHPAIPEPAWFAGPSNPAQSRRRRVHVACGAWRLVLDLDPLILPGGSSLPRNTHRLVVQREGLPSRAWLIHDSPLHNALRWSIEKLTGSQTPPALDLRGMRRIGRLADAAHGSSTSAASLPSYEKSKPLPNGP
ncbi:ABC transporter ATP-binding protein [Streptomyces niveus]|uniref:ABC transporter ATP-binding protein n=1 Tax=Streptomyces niveus TaxID=193462 RepID=UPI0035E1B6ED